MPSPGSIRLMTCAICSASARHLQITTAHLHSTQHWPGHGIIEGTCWQLYICTRMRWNPTPLLCTMTMDSFPRGITGEAFYTNLGATGKLSKLLTRRSRWTRTILPPGIIGDLRCSSLALLTRACLRSIRLHPSLQKNPMPGITKPSCLKNWAEQKRLSHVKTGRVHWKNEPQDKKEGQCRAAPILLTVAMIIGTA